MRTVSYPPAWRQVAIVELSRPWLTNFGKPPESSTLTHTLWLWVYCPVRTVALEGQHSERVTHALVNFTPRFARRVWVLGMCSRSEAFMSSAMMKSMLGLAAVDRKSTRLNSSHANISYAVFC